MSERLVAFFQKQADGKFVGRVVRVPESASEENVARIVKEKANDGQDEQVFWIAGSGIQEAKSAGVEAKDNGLKPYSAEKISAIRKAFNQATELTMNQIVQALGKEYTPELIGAAISNLQDLQENVSAQDVLDYLQVVNDQRSPNEPLLESVQAIGAINKDMPSGYDPRKLSVLTM